MEERRKHTLTDEEMKEIMDAIELQISRTSKRAFMWLALPFIGVVFSLGQVYLQTQKNTIAIETSVLTVKDKDNLDLKIENLSQKIDTNNESLIAAIGELKAEIRRTK